MLEMDSISLHPSLVPWRGVEAERSWSVARRAGDRIEDWGRGGVGGEEGGQWWDTTPKEGVLFLAALDTQRGGRMGSA